MGKFGIPGLGFDHKNGRKPIGKEKRMVIQRGKRRDYLDAEDARCDNCVWYRESGHCDIAIEFLGLQPVAPDHRCNHWSKP